MNAVSGNPLATEFLKAYEILGETAVIPPFVARFQGAINFTSAQTLTISKPGLEHVIGVDGIAISPTTLIQPGIKVMDVRIRILNYEDLPVKLVNGNGEGFPNS